MRRSDPANVFGAASSDRASDRADAVIVNSSDVDTQHEALSNRLKLPVVTKKNAKILHPSGVRALDPRASLTHQ